MFECSLICINFCTDSSLEACVTSGPFSSNVKRQIAVPCSFIMWLQNALLIYASTKSTILRSATLSAPAVLNGCGSKLNVVLSQSW